MEAAHDGPAPTGDDPFSFHLIGTEADGGASTPPEAASDRRHGARPAAVQRKVAHRQRDQASAPEVVGAGPITAATELGAAAQNVTDAAGLVMLITATQRFDEGAVNRLRGTLKALGEVVFRDAHPRPGDAAAIRTALASARSAADALGYVGARGRHANGLIILIGTIEKQGAASARQPADTAKALATKVAGTLDRLERVRELPAPYPKVDHAGLAAAIAQTHAWEESLAGPGAASAARRLATVVPFQHDLVRSADKELAKVLSDPAIADRAHVVAAFVRAMATAADPAHGKGVLAWAKSERDRQLLRTAEATLSGAADDVTALGAAKIDARTGQRAIEQRIDQLEARLIAGGAVDDLVLRETLVTARDHAFTTAMFAIEMQARQLADACAAANSSLIAKAANHWDNDIKKLPGELRQLAKVPHTFRNEYRHRTAMAHHAPAGVEDTRASRIARLTTGTDALDAIEPEARAWAGDGYLQDRLKFAEAELRDSQVRTLVLTLAATVAQVLVGNFAGAAARNLAQAAMVGRGAMATELVVGGAAVATDIGLSTAFQKGVMGDDASILTLAGLNAASAAVGHLIEGGFRGLSTVERDAAANAALWERLALAEERLIAGQGMRHAATLGERAVTTGATISTHMLAGAAVDYAARNVAGERASAPGEQSATDWLLQGAAMGLGRFLGARLQVQAGRSFRGVRDDLLATRSMKLVARAAEVETTGNIDAANALIGDYRALLVAERTQLEARLADRADRDRAPSDALADDLSANGRASDRLDRIEGQRGSPEVPTRATGEQVGAVAAHDPAQIGSQARTDGWIALQGSDTEIAALAPKIRPLPRTVDVLVHGAVDHFIVVRGGENVAVSHRDLARYILRHGGRTARVRLISCRAGAHPKGAAQHLSNKLGVPVLAATDLVHIDRNTGALSVGPSETNLSGTWIEYAPRPSQSRAQPYRARATSETRYEQFKRHRAEAEAGSDQVRDDGAESAAADTSAAIADATAAKTMGVEASRAPSARSPEQAAARAQAAQAIGAVAVAAARGPRGSRDYHITEADGRVILDAVRDLEGFTAMPFRAGLLLRDGTSEWYLAYRSPDAAVDRARAAPEGDLGLPGPNVKTVELWGFRGVREIQGSGDAKPRGPKEWTEVERAKVIDETNDTPLVEFGHVGISFDGGKTIYALTPRTPPGMAVEEIKARLKAGEIFPGRVLDDGEVFRLAHELSKERGWNTQPTRAMLLLEPEVGANLQARVEGQEAQQPEGPDVSRYGFPRRDGDTTACAGVDNCATYPRRLGLPIPEPTGNLRDYIPALERWADADAPIDARSKDELP